MTIITKLQQHGIKWFTRRLIREFIKPTTHFGAYFKFLSPLFYHVFSKPVNFVAYQKINPSPEKNTLYFFYDFEVEPITFDFVWALCVANARREELGLRYLQIILVPGTRDGLRIEQSQYEQVVGYHNRIWRIHSILIPSIHLLSCPYGITLCATRNEAHLIHQKQAKFVYPTHYNVTFPVPYDPELAVIYSQAVMSLRASIQAKNYVSQWLQTQTNHKKMVVITLRQYAYTPERNSNIQAWSKFANAKEKDYFIVFISDTEQAFHKIPKELKKFVFFHEACWNIYLRAAIYELAYLNLGVNTGPMALCWFNAACRYITFKTAVRDVPEVPLKMITSKGFIPGLNPSFANSMQKWVWEDDDLDVISHEFKMMCDVIDFQS